MRIRLALLLLASVVVLMVGSGASAKAQDTPEAYAIVDGIQQPIRVGEVLAEGTRDQAGNCAGVSSIRIAALMPGSYEYGNIELGSDQNSCRVIVTNITFGKMVDLNEEFPLASASGDTGQVAAADSSTIYDARAGAGLDDPVGVHLTNSTVQLVYGDTGSSLQYEYSNHGCSVFPDGWVNDACNEEVNNREPSWIDTGTAGDYHHCCIADNDHMRHYHDANIWAQPGYWGYFCSYDPFDPPQASGLPTLHYSCAGGRSVKF